ncbi:acyltransferase family protein [Pseudomonas inefficax]|uniref:Acyltransferase 3 n=1 Tax=Pseudomonas inefficax TaxID=2078786 RepID=A0AAQ1P9C2_9PSED|nr:acyltransferase family protein [Pseudomonas inefficax]SPO60155.1 Acyltransferase 3 [Pseudomonas inefficax]
MHSKKLAYRPDIDGLRALAVLAVTLFHFNKQWLPGGFVGVDAFFVISGFLITGIIYGNGPSFSFADFYGRRVRRILPAAIFVTAITLITGSLLMMPADVKDLSGSSIAAALSAANIYFWLFLDTSYFAPSSETVPLLHMWSLGVEEQFYLVWPALMIIAMKLGGKRLLAASAVIIAIASFAVSEYYVTREPSFAYYMLPSRAGELLIGALLFLWQDSRRVSTAVANVASFVGLALIAVSLVMLDEKGGFPGIRSIIPSVGAALLILGGSNQAGLLPKILANPIARKIGFRSFSLYLWHWPVLAFYRYAYGEPTLAGGITCALLMWGLTELTYRLIETPFRSHSPRWLITKATPIFATSLAVIAVSYVLVQNKGLWSTASGKVYLAQLNQHDFNTKAASKFPFNCQMFKNDPELWTQDRCLIGDKSTPAETLLWGDSNAAHYVGYLKVVAENSHFALRNISHSSCPPVRELKGLVPSAQQQSCQEFNNKAFAESKNYRTVIIGAAWDNYAKANGQAQFEKTIAELASNGNQVLIALNVPVFEELDRMCSAKAIRFPGMDCVSKAIFASTSDSKTNAFLVELADRYPNVSTFGVRDQVCKSGVCSAYKDGALLYYDRGHLSMIGSELIGREVIKTGTLPQPIAALASKAQQLGRNSTQ